MHRQPSGNTVKRQITWNQSEHLFYAQQSRNMVKIKITWNQSAHCCISKIAADSIALQLIDHFVQYRSIGGGCGHCGGDCGGAVSEVLAMLAMLVVVVVVIVMVVAESETGSCLKPLFCVLLLRRRTGAGKRQQKQKKTNKKRNKPTKQKACTRSLLSRRNYCIIDITIDTSTNIKYK